AKVLLKARSTPFSNLSSTPMGTSLDQNRWPQLGGGTLVLHYRSCHRILSPLSTPVAMVTLARAWGGSHCSTWNRLVENIRAVLVFSRLRNFTFYSTCASGGIGRRARFRSVCP